MPFWNLFWLIVPAVVLLGAAVLSYRHFDPDRPPSAVDPSVPPKHDRHRR